MPDWNFPWLPRVLPGAIPRSTPTIEEQVRCPPGTYRGRPGSGGGCIPRPNYIPDPDNPGAYRPCATDAECARTETGILSEVPGAPEPAPCPPGWFRNQPNGGCGPPWSPNPFPPPRPPGITTRDRPPKEQARGPLPPPILTPPVVPPPVASPSPVDASTGRYFPRSGRTTGGILRPLLGVPGALAWVLGTLVFGPYFTGSTRDYEGELSRGGTKGPPRRRGRGTAEDVPPYYRYEGPWPYPPGTPLPGPFPFPRRTPSAPPTPRTTPSPLPPPARPRAVPRSSPTVRGVPAPAGWTLGDPLPGPGYDPFTYTPPTPAPRPAPRAAPRTGRRVRLPVWFPIGDPVPVTARPLAPRTPALTPQRPPSSPRPRLPLLPQRPTVLTPFQDPVLQPQPLAQRKPTSSNPCTTERTARRRRQRDCNRYTTKTIRVCAD